mgnify:FL=1
MSRDRNAVGKFHAAGQNTVVLARCGCIYSLFQNQISRAASFGMMNGALALHAEPVCYLYVRSDVVWKH